MYAYVCGDQDFQENDKYSREYEILDELQSSVKKFDKSSPRK